MPLFRRADNGFVMSTLAIALLSVLLGAGAAVLSVRAVVTSYSAKDQVAVQNGPANPLDPSKVIHYGG